MHLTRIRLADIPPFTKPIDLKFDPKVNVFIGPNASGKSTLLQVLAEHFIKTYDIGNRRLLEINRGLAEIPEDEFHEAVFEESAWARDLNLISASEDWFGTRDDYYRPEVPPAVVYVGSVREELPSISNQPEIDSYGDTVEKALNGPFSGSRTMCAGDLLGEELRELGDALKLEHADAPYRKLRVLEHAEQLADACSKKICNEVIQDPRSYNYIPNNYARNILHSPHGDPNDINILHRRGTKTTDKSHFDGLSREEQPAYSLYDEPPESLPIYKGHLSSGTQVTLLWMQWLALKIVHHYDFFEGSERIPGNWLKFRDSWQNKPAILLIDEIENHLHPTWQRRVIPALLEHFPGLQIFATTHSPFVVAGLKAGQVHVLKRDENGVVTASTEQRDVIGWTADEILRGMMGVDDPTDDATAQAAQELRKLRQEGPRASEKDEEERQRQIQELRQRVNRDLLAGGPLAAQRELFEQQFAEALENYRRSQDLGQENT